MACWSSEVAVFTLRLAGRSACLAGGGDAAHGSAWERCSNSSELLRGHPWCERCGGTRLVCHALVMEHTSTGSRCKRDSALLMVSLPATQGFLKMSARRNGPTLFELCISLHSP